MAPKVSSVSAGNSAIHQAANIWWSNSIFFVTIHIVAFFGLYFRPPWSVPRATLLLSIILWQLPCFGITVGYHRLYSHRAFRAPMAVRLILAALGSAAFQGSIKWWCLRHRLHHRFTDDPVHDPYSATRGLLFSHMGWIFFKPTYEKLDQVDREDLENDPVVRMQHRYYVPLALFFGLVVPPLLGSIWGDPLGAFIWGGFIARIAIWHCTFLVNSLAHWDGLQPYSDEDTSRGNFIMALLTCGEGNHNFHAFPQDFRSGPSIFDWDPSKWVILTLYKLGLATGLRRARKEDVQNALAWMYHKFNNKHDSDLSSDEEECADWHGPTWKYADIEAYTQERKGRCVIVVAGFAIDVSGYLVEHPGGASLLRDYSVRVYSSPERAHSSVVAGKWKDASWAFDGGLNNHSRAARRQMKELRVAKLAE